MDQKEILFPSFLRIEEQTHDPIVRILSRSTNDLPYISVESSAGWGRRESARDLAASSFDSIILPTRYVPFPLFSISVSENAIAGIEKGALVCEILLFTYSHINTRIKLHINIDTNAEKEWERKRMRWSKKWEKERESEREGEGAKEENASIYFARINCNY